MPQQAATTASVTPVQPSFPAPGAAFMTTGTTPEVRRPRGGKPSNRHLLLAHLGITAVNTFTNIWDAGLVLFGLNLFVLAYMAYRSGYVPRR